ncbi:hypothetical protein RHGRI_003216 [Rhododendron griersonianum]|uniref:GATA-type domain-containing protein n=1 Tax=Rhododendron griersonianum TaxID=479676 RepID=A0AAV6L4N1_9ERIC|nr:hypothetical protein RHGRI_003216 [Rhododendron griersonianum]
MVDLSDKGSESEEMNSSSSTSTDKGSTEWNQIKTCVDCGTSKTPLWRGGPSGPKSLCNACGIRSRKKRRALLGLNKTEDKKSKKNDGNNHNRKLGESIKSKLLALGKEAMWRRSTVEKLRRKLGEEEQAAVLLMALSCGSVYA